eukprot:1047565-Amphidinium_carterae.2
MSEVQTGEHSPVTPDELVVPLVEPTKRSLEDISKALKRKRTVGSAAGNSRASSAETTVDKRMAQEKVTIPPPPSEDRQ